MRAGLVLTGGSDPTSSGTGLREGRWMVPTSGREALGASRRSLWTHRPRQHGMNRHDRGCRPQQAREPPSKPGSTPVPLDEERFEAALETWRREHDLARRRVERADTQASTLMAVAVTAVVAAAAVIGPTVDSLSGGAIAGALRRATVRWRRCGHRPARAHPFSSGPNGQTAAGDAVLKSHPRPPTDLPETR